MGIEAWQLLVHVSRQWRGLVLESPRRLNLQLYCMLKTPARDKVDIWPAFPLIITGNMTFIIRHGQYHCKHSGRAIASVKSSSGALRIGSGKNSWVRCRYLSLSWTDLLLSLDDATLPGEFRSRFVLGWICPTSATRRIIWHSISGIAKTTFVCESACQTYPLLYSSFGVHLT